THYDRSIYLREDGDDADTLPDRVDRRDDWLPRLVLGAETELYYGDRDSVVVGAEYFFNEPGYDGVDLLPAAALAGGFTPLFFGRHYAGLYAVAIAPGTLEDSTIVLSQIGNLSDRSFLTRLDWNEQVLTYMRLTLFAAVHYGE